ncbi:MULTISPECIES: hypothetical protein [unclassified Streptomyces]|uniref:hypothetical protein n=1 Tax=unclassified Streptomyces TaxID=2593676 RepID=UPI002E31D3E7|nr:hypothetical protein [Streptomyces sp. NBC_01280]WSE16763.1 hypothetical protein OG518_27435 [Streptomyces sp. NBC_01397]
MDLWDQRVEPYEAALDGLSSEVLGNLALDVIEATPPLFGHSLDNFFPPSHAELIKSAFTLRRDHPEGWQSDSAFATEFLDRYDALPSVPVRPAVGPFVMALVRLFEAPPRSITADDVMEIHSSCYEAVLMAHLTGRVTIEDELNSDQCVAAIDLQIRLIEGYRDGAGTTS